jgi:ketosteroid isomerase-like protein
MKTTNLFLTATLLVAALCSFLAPVQAQSYKETVAENPNADRDIQIVRDYMQAMVAGDQNKARILVLPTYKNYGPSAADSSTLDQEMKAWQSNYQTQQNRKITTVASTLRVKNGPFTGDWVSVWGEYSFTHNGKTIAFPFHLQVQVSDGKIKNSRIYYDRLSVAQQQGYQLTPVGNAGKKGE